MPQNFHSQEDRTLEIGKSRGQKVKENDDDIIKEWFFMWKPKTSCPFKRRIGEVECRLNCSL